MRKQIWQPDQQRCQSQHAGEETETGPPWGCCLRSDGMACTGGMKLLNLLSVLTGKNSCYNWKLPRSYWWVR